MIIACDFDGTLAFTNSLENCESPNLPLINKLKEAREKGHSLILWTCRGGVWLQEAIDFCKFYGLLFNSVNVNIEGVIYTNISCKVVADLYIDDKSPGSIDYFLNLKL